MEFQIFLNTTNEIKLEQRLPQLILCYKYFIYLHILIIIFFMSLKNISMVLLN